MEIGAGTWMLESGYWNSTTEINYETQLLNLNYWTSATETHLLKPCYWNSTTEIQLLHFERHAKFRQLVQLICD